MIFHRDTFKLLEEENTSVLFMYGLYQTFFHRIFAFNHIAGFLFNAMSRMGPLPYCFQTMTLQSLWAFTSNSYSRHFFRIIRSFLLPSMAKYFPRSFSSTAVLTINGLMQLLLLRCVKVFSLNSYNLIKMFLLAMCSGDSTSWNKNSNYSVLS